MEEEKETIHFPDKPKSFVLFADGGDASFYGINPKWETNEYEVLFRPSPYMRALNQIQEGEFNPELPYIAVNYRMVDCINLTVHVNFPRWLILTNFRKEKNSHLMLRINQNLLEENNGLRNENLALRRELAKLRRGTDLIKKDAETRAINMAIAFNKKDEESQKK